MSLIEIAGAIAGTLAGLIVSIPISVLIQKRWGEAIFDWLDRNIGERFERWL